MPETKGDSSFIVELTDDEKERAKAAAAKRTVDPLKNWARPHRQECKICFLPLPLDPEEAKAWPCCGKVSCWGCILGQYDSEGSSKCPFCRQELTDLPDAAVLANGNTNSMCLLARFYFRGEMGLEEDKDEGLKWYYRAVDAGSDHAAFKLAWFFHAGDGVRKDYGQALYYFQKAAELGNGHSYSCLGDFFMKRGEIAEGMLNYRKAAMCGCTGAEGIYLRDLRNGYVEGYITKEEYAFTLREHQVAIDEMRSELREENKRIKAKLDAEAEERGERIDGEDDEA